MDWNIIYYSEHVQKAILAFPPGILARYLRLTDAIEKFGPNLGMPHTKSLGSALYELRIKGKEGIARAFYSVKGTRVAILHAFVKKSEKTPRKELLVARRRQKEYEDAES